MGDVNLGEHRVGLFGKNRLGSIMEIVEYNTNRDIWVKFIEHENLKHTTWIHFCNGRVQNPYDRTSYGVGFIGEGDYKPWLGDKKSPQYMSWRNMMTRCYSEKEHQRNPRYIECSVIKEWHNFQNFAAWYDQNYYEIEGETMCLDKDILFKGNKVYSPDTCVFVPHRINLLFAKRDAKRGKYPVGVSKIGNRYQASCSNTLGKSETIGKFKTKEEAFNVYKTTKERYIKEVAEEYKTKIPLVLYDAMITYKVKIDD